MNVFPKIANPKRRNNTFIIKKLKPGCMPNVWNNMVDIPDTPPPTILLGVRNEPMAKPVSIAPNMLNIEAFNLFTVYLLSLYNGGFVIVCCDL